MGETILVTSTFILVFTVIIFLCVSFYITIFGGGPFVPTPIPAVLKVLKHANIHKGDRVYDIGAGDNRFVHFATKLYKAKAVGFELNPFIYFIAKIRQWLWGWKGKIIRGNFWKQSLEDADIILCYMMPNSLAKFQKKFDKELKKGTKVVSYAFHIGTWKPKKTIPKNKDISKIWIYEV